MLITNTKQNQTYQKTYLAADENVKIVVKVVTALSGTPFSLFLSPCPVLVIPNNSPHIPRFIANYQIVRTVAHYTTLAQLLKATNTRTLVPLPLFLL